MRVPDGGVLLLALALGVGGAPACRQAVDEGAERAAPLVEANPGARESAPAPERAGGELQRAIVFAELGLTIPLDDPRDHYRNDGFVEDLDLHQAAVVAEFQLEGLELEYTNPAQNGRTLSWTDEEGSWAISFARRLEDERLARALLVHEALHALTHLAPERLTELYLAIDDRGFAVDWDAHDEELRATLVEIVALHAQGVPIESLSGSELILNAVEILKTAREPAR